MKLITFLLFLLSFSALGQDSIYHKLYLAQPVYRPGEVIPAKATNQLVDVEIPAGKSYKLVEVIPTWQLAAHYENNSPAIVYTAGWMTNATGEPKFFGEPPNFAWVQTPNATPKPQATFKYISSKPIKIEFWGERSAGHNPYTLTVDGVDTQIDPRVGTMGSDKDRNEAAYTSPQLNPSAPGVNTEHALVIKPSGQMVVDRITIKVLK